MNMIMKIISTLVLSVSILFAATLTGVVLTTVGILAALLAMVRPKSLIGNYGLQTWLGFDRMWNALLGGDSRETVSSRVGKSLYHGHSSVFYFKAFDRLVAWLLDQVDPDHCKRYIEPLYGRPVD